MRSQVSNRLHLGCGNKKLKGWVNIDLLDSSAADIIDDVTLLTTIKNNSVDEIYACHVLEHITRDQLISTLRLWKSKLVPGGKIKIAVPDFENICSVYTKNKSIEEVIGLVSGGREGKLDEHKIIFDFDYLKQLLHMTGYVNISKYDWRKTDHSNVDDYSQAYLPHMQKDTGTLMSLNVVAYNEGTT
jgi:predicted SAM-dependent methyltransferase